MREELVKNVGEALSGEHPITEGEDGGWTMIGGIKLGSTITIKSEMGVPLFELSIKALPGAHGRPVAQEFNPHGNYPVLLKRDEEGAVERISIKFTEELPYASLTNQNMSKMQSVQIAQAMAALGLMKKKRSLGRSRGATRTDEIQRLAGAELGANGGAK